MTNQLSYHMDTPDQPVVDTTALAHVNTMSELYRYLIDNQLYLTVKAGLAPQVHINGSHWFTNGHIITNAHNAAQLVSNCLTK